MTSLSSGNSSDDRWYDMLDAESVPGSDFVSGELVPPPALPTRAMASSFSSGLSSSSSSTTVIPLQKSASHSKIKATSSLPLPSTPSTYSLPVTTDVLHSNDSYSFGGAAVDSPDDMNFVTVAAAKSSSGISSNSSTNNCRHDFSNSGIDEKLACLMKAERSREFRRYLDKHSHDQYKSKVCLF